MPNIADIVVNNTYRKAIAAKLNDIDLLLEAEDCSVLDEWHFVLTAQQLALIFDDMEMLGIATKLQLKKLKIFEVAIEEDESCGGFDRGMFLKTRQEGIDRNNAIQQAMEQCFFNNEQLMPKMEQFQRRVESNKQHLMGIARYQELSNYVDSKASAKRFFNAVKKIVSNMVWSDIGSPHLLEKVVIEQFSRELPRFYERAERHLDTFIKE
jgi:hypothetical protein